MRTIDLLNRALKKHPAKFWCDRYSITQSTLSTEKGRGRLSPAIAGNLAIDLGEDARHWMAIAAMEADRKGPMYDRLRKMLLHTNP